MCLAVAFLLQADDESHARIVGLVFAAVVAWFLTLSINRVRRGAAAPNDDFVETAREIRVPARCASCGASAAPHRIAVKRGFVFHFCDQCAPPVRRRAPLRGLATFLWIVLLLHAILFFGMRLSERASSFVQDFATKHGLPASKLISILWFDMIVAIVVLAPVAWLLASAPAVRVSEWGEKMRFRFRNDAYRNEFDEMNR